MLDVPTEFPHVGSYGYMDDKTPDGRDVVERIRIQQDKGNGLALVSLIGRRYAREIASGTRTVPFSALRETEQPPRSRKPSGRKPKAPRAASAQGKAKERRS